MFPQTMTVTLVHNSNAILILYITGMVLTVIHIGKCGGSSVTTLLKSHRISHRSVHIDKPEFKRTDKYVILIRNPISRFISAFNWRYKLVVTDKSQENRFPGEKAALITYGSVNNLAENIEIFNKQYIHHIHENIDYYLSDFLKTCKKESILGVITQENFDADVKTVFDITNNMIHAKNNSDADKYLSAAGYELLKKHLHKDYECIDKLFAMNCITKEQYDVLSK